MFWKATDSISFHSNLKIQLSHMVQWEWQVPSSDIKECSVITLNCVPKYEHASKTNGAQRQGIQVFHKIPQKLMHVRTSNQDTMKAERYHWGKKKDFLRKTFMQLIHWSLQTHFQVTEQATKFNILASSPLYTNDTKIQNLWIIQILLEKEKALIEVLLTDPSPSQQCVLVAQQTAGNSH